MNRKTSKVTQSQLKFEKANKSKNKNKTARITVTAVKCLLCAVLLCCNYVCVWICAFQPTLTGHLKCFSHKWKHNLLYFDILFLYMCVCVCEFMCYYAIPSCALFLAFKLFSVLVMVLFFNGALTDLHQYKCERNIFQPNQNHQSASFFITSAVLLTDMSIKEHEKQFKKEYL